MTYLSGQSSVSPIINMAYTFASGFELTITNDNIAIICMRNGENRIDKTFIDAFNEALDAVERNNQCRALITTSEGKFFSNGFKLDNLLKPDEEHIRNRPMFGKLTNRILTFPIVTIAAINGHAFAGGALLALYQDYRVMQTKRGWISLNEIFTKIGLSSHLSLIRAKFSGRAKHDLVMGKRFTAEEAKEGGIVDVVSTPEALMSSATELANQYTQKQTYDRNTLRTFKEDLYRDVVDSLDKLLKSR